MTDFKEKDDVKAKDVLNLTGTYLKRSSNFKYGKFSYFSFDIHYPNHQTKSFFCQSEEEYEIWINKINLVTGFEDIYTTYKLRETLGEGYYGIVKSCEHIISGRQAAIKIVPKKEMNIKEMIQIRTEIEILKVCQHPNIVRLYDLYENDEYIYISKYIE